MPKRTVTKMQLVRRVMQLERAIQWALGEVGVFPEEPPLAGKYRRRFYWRTELRERAGLSTTLPAGRGRI